MSHRRNAPLLAATAAAALALAGLATQSAYGGAKPKARSAGTFELNENGNLHLTSKHGFTLNEQGRATGTVKGTIYVHLTIVSSSRVTAEMNIYPSNGSITAKGSAAYHRGHSSASFSGSLSVVRGTGAYSHAHGSGLSQSGTIQRSNDAVTVHVSGRAAD
ncbi:MAG: hypothetical protein ACRDK4_10910 [Solirubrobacteraceae bacterium]